MVDWLTILQTRAPKKTRASQTESCYSDVPPEVWSLILSRLFFNDRHNFRLVCKSWYSILPVKPTLPPPANSPDSHWPCLMYSLNSSTTSWKFYHSLYNEFYTLDFPELIDAKIYFSSYGWLIMARKGNLFFFNPFTKVKIELPQPTNPLMSACFTSSPTSPDCYVCGLYFVCGYGDLKFGLIKVGDEDWKSEACHQERSFPLSNGAPFFHEGMYYLVDYVASQIGIFDPRKDENRWTQFRTEEEEEEELTDEEEEEAEIVLTTKKKKLRKESYLAEVDGEIWGVFVTTDDRRVSVKKLDLTEMRWRKVDSLGNKCLYVSPYGSFAETCAVSGMANKIYFNKFHGNSGIMYSLTTRMYHSIAGNFASKGAGGLRHVVCGAWIRNSHR